MKASTSITDEKLMERVQSGERSAFTILYERHSAAVISQVYRTMGSNADAEDVCQEVFWKAWCQAQCYDFQRSSPRTWLLMLARYAAMDRLRGIWNHRRKSVLIDEHSDDSRFCAAVEPDPVERDEECRLVREAMEALPERQSNAVSLACLRGLKRWQIAGLEQLPVGTVKTLIRRASIRLKGAEKEVA